MCLNQNALKRIEMQRLPLWLDTRKNAQSPIGEGQPYLPHVSSRVPRSVHAKFHASSKLWALERYQNVETHIYKYSHTQTYMLGAVAKG